jgi:hypothetical protein
MANEETGEVMLPEPVEATPTQALGDSGDSGHSWLSVLLSAPLSRVQAVVGVLAGCLTIVGTLVGYTGLTKPPAPVQGEIVAHIQLGNTHKPLPGATVEILTAQDAIVTTLTPELDGRVSRKLKEGRYRLRVTHPNLVPESRTVEVHAGQQSTVRVALVPRPTPRVVRTVAAAVKVQDEPGAFRKFFKNLGFD